MSVVNIHLAIDLPVWNKIQSNITRNENGIRGAVDFPESIALQLKAPKHRMWKAPNAVGSPDIMVMWRVPLVLNEAGTGLQLVGDLVALYGNKIEVFGAWNTDGTQLGWDTAPITFDADGMEEPVYDLRYTHAPDYGFWHTTDNALYPQSQHALSTMPDDVVTDENGVELSRTVATAFSDVLAYAGDKPRIYL